MSRLGRHLENHLVGRIGWLRAAVLGANDGIISTASFNHSMWPTRWFQVPPKRPKSPS